MPSLTFRFTPTFVKVKEMLTDGALGEPTSAIYRELIPASDLAKQWPPESWMWNIQKSGSVLTMEMVNSWRCKLPEMRANSRIIFWLSLATTFCMHEAGNIAPLWAD